MLATALYEAGRTEAAERQYRLLLERQPGSGAARVALAESLLSQTRYADAAAEAAALPDEDPHAAAARRSELFARLVAGEAEGAAALLARAEAAGMGAGELALFGAWQRIAAGDVEAARSPLPFEAVAPLATALEALLRVQEVDAFAALVGLLDGCPIAPRERRELRARMYLRRGFLASAAEEWMEVCQQDPRDVRGLVGLAQVAAANGMTEDAIDFAREARVVDPEERRAARLLERLAPLAA
jgi:thioredoxin-like negative regulator of GroEL